MLLRIVTEGKGDDLTWENELETGGYLYVSRSVHRPSPKHINRARYLPLPTIPPHPHFYLITITATSILSLSLVLYGYYVTVYVCSLYVGLCNLTNGTNVDFFWLAILVLANSYAANAFSLSCIICFIFSSIVRYFVWWKVIGMEMGLSPRMSLNGCVSCLHIFYCCEWIPG